MVYVIDIDGTICTQTSGGQYNLARPYIKRIEVTNKLYDTGNTIKLFTARGSTLGIDYRSLTEEQLSEWGVKYHELHFGKIDGDIFIDDKSINSEQFFKNSHLWK